MKRTAISVTLPRPINGVSICQRSVAIQAQLHDVTLGFDGAEHVDEFLSRFADAWARWHRSDEEEVVTLLQQTLPF